MNRRKIGLEARKRNEGRKKKIRNEGGKVGMERWSEWKKKGMEGRWE